MAVTIAVMSYSGLTSLIKGLSYDAPPEVKIEIYNAILEDSLQVAKSLEDKKEVDVFVSAGGNARLLAQHLKTPLVEIVVTGFDFLLAVGKAQKLSKKVAIITYLEKLPYLDKVSDSIAVDIKQVTYGDMSEVDSIIDGLRAEGITVVIGASLVVEKARKKGMHSIFIYSEDGVARALDSAIKVALTKKAEMERAEELQTIINFAYGGIIATDKKGIVTEFNPSAEKITGITRQAAVGRCITEVLPGTRLHNIIKSRQTELNQIQVIGDIKILTNRVPIISQGEVAGSVALFQDIGAIQEAEEKIRQRLYQKGFLAKTTFPDIKGQSEILARVKREAILYAKSDSTILIRGETGTGKELFAQGIHNDSARVKRPFVAINCAALPENLLESELFGFEEGAFTGAKKGGKPGLFELAHGGTIFLDEIGEIPMPIQSRLLRVLEAHEVLRIGGERIVPVNIRVITATNKDLWEMVRLGNFREDLYYRLCVLEINIPPLRKRKEDIPLLIENFLRELRKDLSCSEINKISRHSLFLKYHWPGNIRELRNIIERFCVLYSSNSPADKLMSTLLSEKLNTVCNVDAEEKEKLMRYIEEAGGNKSEAARKLGISRTTLWRKLQELS